MATVSVHAASAHSIPEAEDLCLDNYSFQLPPERIAQHPCSQRAASRLYVLPRDRRRTAQDSYFYQLCTYLQAGDLLVFNDTRVLPARLYGRKPSGGRVELLLIAAQQGQPCCWQCLARASKPLAAGTCLVFPGETQVVVRQRLEDGSYLVAFPSEAKLRDLVQNHGEMPLPPYIQRGPQQQDQHRYQTVYARHEGSVAAPTAGLHFDANLLQQLQQQEVEMASLTLHVGPGTFQPVRQQDLRQHRMHKESYYIPEATVAAIQRTQAQKRRVIAVGTTTTRALEDAARSGELTKGAGVSELFIYPGYSFQVIDGLITNFHLPGSSLLMLVAALVGRKRLLAAYEDAVAKKYRFFSYGDAMLVT